MIGIINTGMGNIPSVSSALNKIDCDFVLCSNKNDLDRVSKIILPGVGAIQSLPIKVNGDGEDKLDFTYIEDLVNGIVNCCENENAINQIFNITFGNSRKINEMLEILKSEFPNIQVSYAEREKFMPERGTLKIDKAKKLLGFESKFSIEEGYQKYIKWYKDFWKKINI